MFVQESFYCYPKSERKKWFKYKGLLKKEMADKKNNFPATIRQIRPEENWKAMFATPGAILPKICDWTLNKNRKPYQIFKTIGNRFQFPSLCHRVKALPEYYARK